MATSHKAAAVQPTISYLKKKNNNIQVEWKIHADHCWKSKDELKSAVLQWTTADKRASIDRPGRTYLYLLYVDTGCSFEDLPGAMNDPIYQPLRSGRIWHKVNF